MSAGRRGPPHAGRHQPRAAPAHRLPAVGEVPVHYDAGPSPAGCRVAIGRRLPAARAAPLRSPAGDPGARRRLDRAPLRRLRPHDGRRHLLGRDVHLVLRRAVVGAVASVCPDLHCALPVRPVNLKVQSVTECYRKTIYILTH